MDEFFKRFDALAAKLQQAAPVAWDKLITLEQMKSGAELIIMLGMYILCLTLVLFANHLMKVGSERHDKALDAIIATNAIKTDRYYKKTAAFILWVISGVVLLGNIVFNTANKWMWVGLVSPESRLINDLWSSLAK